MDSLVYALIQVVHNFGAAAVVGFSAYGLTQGGEQTAARRRILFIAGSAWAVQAASGAAFGLTTWHFYHELPDIHGTAVAALIIKMICVAIGLLAAALALRRGSAFGRCAVAPFAVQFTLGVTALSAAAFLRWFS